LEELPWISRVLLATDIADAMTFLHERKYIHRDLKSPNVLLQISSERESESGGVCFLKAKVADFGTSRQTDLIHTFSSSTVQNPRWLAPEIIQGESYNEMVDVYSFGIFFHSKCRFFNHFFAPCF
jgi:serine/threonine protein kinase